MTIVLHIRIEGGCAAATQARDTTSTDSCHRPAIQTSLMHAMNPRSDMVCMNSNIKIRLLTRTAASLRLICTTQLESSIVIVACPTALRNASYLLLGLSPARAQYAVRPHHGYSSFAHSIHRLGLRKLVYLVGRVTGIVLAIGLRLAGCLQRTAPLSPEPRSSSLRYRHSGLSQGCRGQLAFKILRSESD